MRNNSLRGTLENHSWDGILVLYSKYIYIYVYMYRFMYVYACVKNICIYISSIMHGLYGFLWEQYLDIWL